MALDERLRRELDRAAQPADPSGLYEHLIRRRERRQIARKVQSGLLAIVVLAGSVGAFYALTRIFSGSETPDVATPSVSSGEIVFSIPLEGEGEALMAVAPNGSGLRRLTPEGRADYRSPDVSPDGRTVVVVHSIPSFENEQAAVLATVPIEGGSPTWLTDTPQIVLDPTWSPDGRTIAFAGEIVGGPFGLYVLDVDTGEARLVPGTDNMLTGDPTWSPDGERLAFEGAVPDPVGPGGTGDVWDIYSVGVDGSALTNLTQTPDEGEFFPAWSWEVDQIAFVRGVPRGSGVFTMASDGSDETLVFDALPNLSSPAWSPDGTMLAFSADTGQVYTVRADGTDLRLVMGALGEPAWQSIQDDGIPVPTPTPQPTPSPTPQAGEDIGLGFLVCFSERLAGIDHLGDGTNGSAWMAVPSKQDGTCPRYPDPEQFIVAADFTGDRVADSWVEFDYGCYNGCAPWDATDLDANGTEELIVATFFSIMDYHFFAVRPGPNGDLSLEPILVASPGHEPARIAAGEPLRIDAGGDAGYGSSIDCEGYPAAPVIVWSWIDGPVEGNQPLEVHVTRIELQADGLFHVVDTNDSMVPAGTPFGIPYQSELGRPACGVVWYR